MVLSVPKIVQMDDQFEVRKLMPTALPEEMRCRRPWRGELGVTSALYVGQPRETLQVLTTQIDGMHLHPGLARHRHGKTHRNGVMSRCECEVVCGLSKP